WHRIYFHASLTVFFWLPLAILVVVYAIIAKRLVRDDRRLLIASAHSSFVSNHSGPGPRSSSLACVSTASKESSVWPDILCLHGPGSAMGPAGSRAGSASGPAGRPTMSAEKAQIRSRRQVSLCVSDC